MRSSSPGEREDPRAPRHEAKEHERNGSRRPGRLDVVSLGPGSPAFMAPEAARALRDAEVIAGYGTYLDLIPEYTAGKAILSSGMRREIERCAEALDAALAGRRTALVSSGDAGIYGMAGLVLDLARERNLRVGRPGDDPTDLDLIVSVTPGIPAFAAAASLLGAPLMHDFCAISLSDHLTPWPAIEKRLEAAAAADFVIAIYNPQSRSRPDVLKNARDILLRGRSPETPVGIVRKAMREGEWRHIATLSTLPFEEVDMQTVLLVGNSHTYEWRSFLVTPRGYLDKYHADGERKRKTAAESV